MSEKHFDIAAFLDRDPGYLVHVHCNTLLFSFSLHFSPTHVYSDLKQTIISEPFFYLLTVHTTRYDLTQTVGGAPFCLKIY